MSDRAWQRTPVTAHRLRWWNRLRWRLGLVPFQRCPGQHRVRNLYGDEIITAGGLRSRCMDCTKRWPGLWGKTNEVGVLVETAAAPEEGQTDGRGER